MEITNEMVMKMNGLPQREIMKTGKENNIKASFTRDEQVINSISELLMKNNNKLETFTFSHELLNTIKANLKLNKDACLQEVIAVINGIMQPVNELEKLKLQRAELSIDELILKGIIDTENREHFIKLCTIDFDIAMGMINKSHLKKTELESLLKLSGNDLYMAGKFARLKELSHNDFLMKHKEFFGVDY